MGNPHRASKNFAVNQYILPLQESQVNKAGACQSKGKKTFPRLYFGKRKTIIFTV
jgi:hypothetical protein